MKFETLLLSGLFVACMAVCTLIMGAMIYAKPAATHLATRQTLSEQLLTAPNVCAMPADGVVCPQQRG
jgi:hypothetical protein